MGEKNYKSLFEMLSFVMKKYRYVVIRGDFNTAQELQLRLIFSELMQ